MAWIRLDVLFFQHRKALAAGRDGRDLYIASLCYCGAELNDGAIPADALPLLGVAAGVRQVDAAAARLVAVELWERDGDDFRVHDYLDHQTSRERTLQTSAARAASGSRGGQQTAQRRGSNGPANARQNGSNLPDVRYDVASSKIQAELELETDTEPRTARAPPPPPVNAPGARTPPREGRGVVGGGLRALIGPETWAAILRDLRAIDPNLGDTWLGDVLATEAGDLDRRRLLTGLNTWRGRILAKKQASDQAPPALKVHYWEGLAAKTLAVAIREARRYDD
jgi:hypothetical protein